MAVKQEYFYIVVQGGVTNGVAKVKRIKNLRKFQTKIVKILQYKIQHKSMQNTKTSRTSSRFRYTLNLSRRNDWVCKFKRKNEIS